MTDRRARREDASRRARLSASAKRGWETRREKERERARAAKRRSVAAKRGWETRRANAAARLEERRLGRSEGEWQTLPAREFTVAEASEFRSYALPTREELFDYLAALAQSTGVDMSQLYRWYFGYA
jgi:hypothetical protein